MTKMAKVCMKKERFFEDWPKACEVLILNGKGERCECKNIRGINILDVSDKVFGRVMIE